MRSVDTVAVVYVMRGAFKRRHLLAEGRRHLSYVLRGRPHEPAWTNRAAPADPCPVRVAVPTAPTPRLRPDRATGTPARTRSRRPTSPRCADARALSRVWHSNAWLW
ncbi:hypothetical protein ACWD9X_39175 [Streptomyces sp. NPDC005075]